MKVHTLMAGAAVLAFATGAIAQDAAAPATPDSAVAGSPSADAVAPDAAAPMDAAPDATGVPEATMAPAASAPSAAATAPDQMDASAAQSAMTAPMADPAKAQAADQMIAQSWSKYDAGNKGQLTPLEFGTWVLAAQGNDMTSQVEKSRHSKAANLASTKVLNATAAEFSKADTNMDRQVSQEELKAYLSA
jgi:hypothetical protein